MQVIEEVDFNAEALPHAYRVLAICCKVVKHKRQYFLHLTLYHMDAILT